jgi:hypothetical protein
MVDHRMDRRFLRLRSGRINEARPSGIPSSVCQSCGETPFSPRSTDKGD